MTAHRRHWAVGSLRARQAWTSGPGLQRSFLTQWKSSFGDMGHFHDCNYMGSPWYHRKWLLKETSGTQGNGRFESVEPISQSMCFGGNVSSRDRFLGVHVKFAREVGGLSCCWTQKRQPQPPCGGSLETILSGKHARIPNACPPRSHAPNQQISASFTITPKSEIRMNCGEFVL